MFGIRVWQVGAVVSLSTLLPASWADDDWPRPVLHVVRLKPGEVRTFELALPKGEFLSQGKSGRDILSVQRLARAESKSKSEPVLPDGKGVYDLGSGLTLVWEKGKPGVSVRAANDAKPGTIDLRVQYLQFTIGAGEHILGYRVVIQRD